MKGLWIGRRGVGLAVASKCHVEFLFHRMRGDREGWGRRIRIDDLCRRREEETDNGGSMPFK